MITSCKALIVDANIIAFIPEKPEALELISKISRKCHVVCFDQKSSWHTK